MKTLALVVGSQLQGENNKILTLLTPSGRINAIAYRGATQKSSIRPLTDILCYMSADLSQGKSGLYSLKGGEIIENFYDLRLDYEKLKSACSIAKIAKRLILTDLAEKLETLQLTLNTIYIIQKRDDYPFVQAIFLCRLLSIIGYMPRFDDDITLDKYAKLIASCNKNKIFSYLLDESLKPTFIEYMKRQADEYIDIGEAIA